VWWHLLKPEFPQIKVMSKDIKDIDRVRRLRRDLKDLKNDILLYAPSNFDADKLSRLRLRIFRLPSSEDCAELFIMTGNRRYVCLNSWVVNSGNYYSGLQYLLHGIAHSFCHLNDDIAEEVFCEYVSYNVLKKLLDSRGRGFSKRIIRSLMNGSRSEYNDYYRAARKLEKRRSGLLLNMNTWAKNRKMSRKKQRRVFYKLLKVSRYKGERVSDDIPELEKGFKKLR
jgi:hypothetical protein